MDKETVEIGSNCLKFIAQIVSAVAWPVTTIICILLLKRYLLALVPLLRTVKYSDVEIKFGQEVSELVKITNISSLPKEPPVNEINPWEDLITLANVQPRTAIRSAWQRVEETALQVAKNKTSRLQKLR
jgi:hypothetical protein